MMSSGGGSCWALILAGGSGTRLRSLTTPSAGNSIPKQFCSLRGGPSLLHEALRRALVIAPNAFIIAGRATSLLQLFERNTNELVLRMRKALQGESTGCADSDALRALYGTLAPQDFSRRRTDAGLSFAAGTTQ